MKIGVVGLGYVGRAVQHSWLNTDHDVIFTDPNVQGGIPLIQLIQQQPKAIFICVPTPSNSDGSCDTSIVKETLEFIIENDYDGTIIVKSTTDPMFWKKYQGMPEVWHIPEFLTASNANQDYLNPKFIFVGGNGDSLKLISLLSSSRMDKSVKFYWTDLVTASLVKYFMNTFLATKVIMLNQFKLIADAVGAEWFDFNPMLSMDTRMGDSHLQVPGSDGQLGYGGACFPKDTAALLQIARQYEVEMSVLEAAVKKNTLLRLK